MIDLHTHSIFSDGVLVPSELVRRAEVLGLKAIGITDHADASNLDFIIPRIVAVSESLNRANQIKTVPGIELTHVPPSQIGPLAEEARSLGAKIIVVHGETIAEPVAPGTNRAALTADIDILAHPGLISEEEVLMAAEKGIFLEITARKGHSLTNGHVAQLAKKHGAELVLNTDTHEPSDLITEQQARQIVLGAGLSQGDFERMQKNAKSLL
ncbi:MAG: histidinol phosphate phosphatase domain-containing protein [Deltaproteobacteria bacterium]|nr:histidinol phosphate phosphatase domain-containing protein [Deltaproteobacteria bacterium]MBW2018400.1 histidinol phosphate phosphatase domain-containing protein [Deltaproteobacteria bacterium]MBW2073686.1 histidinol phosphate phosphatase domain-containing protein [Deltaproteobacteria bacterium]RLB82811.1 MAG: PHP domain-containing protein [Deltaproteobacteria bacterium]